MKQISKILLTAIAVIGMFAACNKIDNLKKVEALPVYQLGVSPVLSSSSATVVPALTDTNGVAVTFNWTNPKYSNDSLI